MSCAQPFSGPFRNTDRSANRLKVSQQLTCNGKTVLCSLDVGSMRVPGGATGDVLTNAGDGKVAWQSAQEGPAGPTGPTGPAGPAAGAMEYMFANMTSAMAGVTANTDIDEFKTALDSRELTLTDGVVGTLKAGKTYELTAYLYCRVFSDTSAGFCSFAWVDSATNTLLYPLPLASSVPTTSDVGENYAAYASIIYTPTADQSVKVRTQSVTGTCAIDNTFSYIKVVEIYSGM